MIESIKVQKAKCTKIQVNSETLMAVAVDFSSNLLVTGRAPKIAQRLQISGSKVTLSLANSPRRLASSILYERCISTSLPWKLHKYIKSTKQIKTVCILHIFLQQLPERFISLRCQRPQQPAKRLIHDIHDACATMAHHPIKNYAVFVVFSNRGISSGKCPSCTCHSLKF